MTARIAWALVAAVPAGVVAQPRPLEPGSYEVFGEVRYLGGDSRFPKAIDGVLVVTDTALLFVEYRSRTEVKDAPLMVIPLRQMTRLVGAADRHEAPLLDRLLVGILAGSKRDELVAVAFDRDATAEAPVFRTKPHESSALLAKVRYRLKRLGIRIDPSSADSSPAGEVWQPTATAIHR